MAKRSESPTRSHSAFLHSYAAEDEGLYDDFPTWQVLGGRMRASKPTTTYRYIVRRRSVLAGEPRIAGHRIRVRDIVAARDLGGLTAEEIAASVYPQLTLAQIYSALAYYEDHRDEIDQAFEAEEDFLEKFKRQHPALVRDLRPSLSIDC